MLIVDMVPNPNKKLAFFKRNISHLLGISKFYFFFFFFFVVVFLVVRQIQTTNFSLNSIYMNYYS